MLSKSDHLVQSGTRVGTAPDDRTIPLVL